MSIDHTLTGQNEASSASFDHCDQIRQFFCTLGNFFKPLATISLPKSLTFLGNFCKGVKIYHFSIEIILQTFGDFYLVTLALINKFHRIGPFRIRFVVALTSQRYDGSLRGRKQVEFEKQRL